jgi:hypothetical protein
MTLKDRLQEEQVYINPYTFKLTKEGAEKFEQIADEFAIGFAEWLSMFTQEFEDGDLRHWNKDKWERRSMKELLEIYKKEKGL